MQKNKTVIGLSGGMDSATLLGILLGQGVEVHCCSFYYGSKHGIYETKAAEQIVNYYGNNGFPIYLHKFDLHAAFQPFKSNLLQGQGNIPEGHYNDDNMKQTVVPGRNLIFASIMAGLAESIEANEVALGVHSGDHHIYPDCRPIFINSLQNTIYQSSDKKINVTTPLLHLDKTSILKLGFELKPVVPYQLTRTCYKEQPISCGKCGSCQERLEAFNNINKKDLIQYEK